MPDGARPGAPVPPWQPGPSPRPAGPSPGRSFTVVGIVMPDGLRDASTLRSPI
jgi:hypothetical protein